MKVLIFTVNYHNDHLIDRFVSSMIESKNKTNDVELELNILDNSGKNSGELKNLNDSLTQHDLDFKIHTLGFNSGYFGGLKLCQDLVSAREDVDIVIYCNCDLYFDISFFSNLSKKKNKKHAMIAPAIITIGGDVDQNPKYMSRLSFSKLKFLERIYSNSLLFTTHDILSKVKEWIFKRLKREADTFEAGTEIYAPHGAVFVFTDIGFFKDLPEFECFLFGEEIFIAEEAVARDKTIVYEPSLAVYDERHASISLVGVDKRRKFHADSIEYILSRYYR
ncbi:hypothetical protein [Vibrio splendidus]|uniref:hypothetical protein n=1 Tax=Vibrio splendidus TaxID=29497 RepID=UPI00036EDB97|nr:hypothetical protein [Vibrio splendidus]